MTKDKIIKLIKLANGNPNDNEANLAARRVCKAIAENNFTLNERIQPPNFTQPIQRPNPAQPSDIWNQFYKQWTNDKEYFSGGSHGRNKTYNPNYEYEYDKKSYKREPKEKRNLKCKTCKKNVDTIFQGLEELFECNVCQWSAYAKGK